MKRRNAEGGKLRRPIKRTKITESIYGSTLLYLKFLMLWALVLLADFVLEFRFEFLWPFWLLLRSVYDSFKYQGLAFSAFFVCVAATSDMICFFFIPVHWLFFLASTYVWVQYVWHTEKGICLPTVILCMLFVYVEAAVRLRGDFRHPFHVDLCRPFAAHCIGYPVVTFGFGFKSYVGYRMRQRRQKEVAKENEFYMQLLQQALPAQQEVQTPVANSTSPEKNKGTPSPIAEHDNGKMLNGSVANGITVSPNSSVKNNHRKSLDKGPEKDQQDKKISHNHANGSIHADVEYIERISSVNDFDANEIEKDKVTKGCNNRSQEKGGNKWNSSKQAQENVVNSQREKRSKNNKESHTETNNFTNKDEYLQRLEADVKRLKIDLQSSRQIEQDLRSQLVSVTNCERSAKSELTQLQHHNDDLQTRLHGLVNARQLDKQAMSQLEKKLADERRARGSCEAQLAAERKAKKAEEAAAAQAVAIATALNKGECTESCRARRRELEAETKQLKRELKLKEERILSGEREIQNLRQYRDTHSETEILMSALSAMQDKTTHLENSLSAETKIKLDLFSALGEAKRQLEIRENLIRAQEKELEELKAKLAQVLAVMPTEPFCSSPPPTSGTSKFRLSESHLRCFTNDDSFGSMASLRSLTESPVSTLDPNATAYTPKGTLCAKYFAEELHRSLPLMFPAPEITGLLELEWHETLTDWRRLYGAEFWNLRRPVAVFLDGRFIGSDTDLLKITCDCDIFVVSIPMKSSSLLKQKFTSDYLSYLKNTKLIYCYFDMCVDETFIGTLVFQLYSNILPKTCENFITLCLGSKGSSLSYKGSRIHRIVEHGWLQGGDLQNCAGGGRSNTLYSTLEDECFGISHDRRGVLSMVKNGRYTNSSQFLITLGPHTWMDTRYVAFGQVIEGVQVLDRMENVETIREFPLKKIEIKNCGKFDIQDANEVDKRHYPDMREPVPKKRYGKLETVGEQVARLIMEALTDCLARKEHRIDVIHIDDAPSRTRLDFFFQGYYSLSEEAVNEMAKYLRTFRREMLRYIKPTATEIVEVIAYDLQEAVFAKLVDLDDVREAMGHPLFNELLEKMDMELEICEKPYIEKFVNQLVATAENMLKLISKKLNWIRRSSRKNRDFQEQMDEWVTSFVLQETFLEDRYHIVDRSPGDTDDVPINPCQENVVKKKEKEPINAETCCNKDRERDYFNIREFFSICRYELRKPKRDREERVTTMELIECGRNHLRALRPEENRRKSKKRICLEKKISHWLEGVTYVYDTEWIRQTVFAKEDVCFSHTEEIMYGAMTIGLLEIYYLMEEYLKKPKKKVYRTRVIYPESYTTSEVEDLSEESYGKSAKERESKLELEPDPGPEKVIEETEPCPCGDVCCDCPFKPVIKDGIMPPTPPPSLVISGEEEGEEVDVSKEESSTSSCTPTSAIDVEELMAQIVGESTENINVKSFKWMEDYILCKGCQLKSDFAQQVHKWLENEMFNHKFLSKHSLVTRASLLSFSLSLASLMKEENELRTELKDFVYDLWELYFIEMIKEAELLYPPQDKGPEASEEVYKTVAEDGVTQEKASVNANDACKDFEEKTGADFDFDLFCRHVAAEEADESPNTEKEEVEEVHETEKLAAAPGADMEIPGENGVEEVEDEISRTADVVTQKAKRNVEPRTIRELVVSTEEVRQTSPYALPFWIKFLAEVTKMALGMMSKASRGPRRLYFTTDSQISIEDRMKAWVEFNKFHSPTTDRRDLQDFIAKHHVDVDDLDATARSFLKKKVIVEMMERTTRKRSAEILAEELILELLAKIIERLDVGEGKYKVSAAFMQDLIGMTGVKSYPESNEDGNDEGDATVTGGREYLGEE